MPALSHYARRLRQRENCGISSEGRVVGRRPGGILRRIRRDRTNDRLEGGWKAVFHPSRGTVLLHSRARPKEDPAHFWHEDCKFFGMRTSLDCLPCFARQAVDLVRGVTDEPEEQERLMRRLLRALTEMDWNQPAPVLAQRLHALMRPLLPVDDPYREAKETFNRLALAAYPEARARIRESSRPFETALKLAAAGNIVDVGVHRDLKPEDFQAAIKDSLSQELKGDVEGLWKALGEAERVLYIADNTGEIVFDKLLLELLPREKVTVAVRGGPILNDATLEDAQRVGLTEIVEVIDNGSDAPGVVLEDCGNEFVRLFREADVVVAKGQGNFETLSGGERKVFFLLKAKCEVVARQLDCRLGDLVLHRSADPPTSP